MLPGRVSNPGPLTYESGALPIALRGPASLDDIDYFLLWTTWTISFSGRHGRFPSLDDMDTEIVSHCIKINKKKLSRCMEVPIHLNNFFVFIFMLFFLNSNLKLLCT